MMTPKSVQKCWCVYVIIPFKVDPTGRISCVTIDLHQDTHARTHAFWKPRRYTYYMSWGREAARILLEQNGFGGKNTSFIKDYRLSPAYYS